MKATSFLALFILISCSHPDTPVAPIDAKDRHYKQCFEESDSYRDKNVKPTGKVSIGFTLMPDGDIEGEKILESDFKDPNFHACLLDITRSLKLTPKSDVSTNYVKKLNFSSKVKIYDE